MEKKRLLLQASPLLEMLRTDSLLEEERLFSRGCLKRRSI